MNTKTKVYIYGLCNVFYDGYYILGLKAVYGNFEFNISKFPNFNQGTFAVIIEDNNELKNIIIDSRDSNEIDTNWLEWCDIYGKINYNKEKLFVTNENKIIAIGPSFGIKIWDLFYTLYYLILNFFRFKNTISNKKEFIANYWRQYKRFRIDCYTPSISSENGVFFISSIWKKEEVTNKNRALFIECCKSNLNINFEGGFAARTDGDNLGFEKYVYSKKIHLKLYIKKIKNSAFVFNTPAVLNCHGWKLAEYLALGKAIISTSHINTLPNDLINGKHLIYADSANKIKLATEELIMDRNLKFKLEFNSRKYFEKYLAPRVVVQKLIEDKN
ncbi:glycosyltransferase [Flavobacterium seoulense]|uniref:Glycosyl transferase family 1 domain-containing protein n=1 Tax=Flavobacterium seoulense TaxID=1492738 RepID=A0A066WTY0_9FLAO|nr:hypothetical protein [Flavobacterium seoulense]KDN56038.1 hypothetical protein FEM21_09370 [Flavobacterium seoulense]